MRKFLFSILQFSAFLSVCYVLLVIAWGEFVPLSGLKKNMNYRIGSYGHMYSRLQEAKSTRNVDILFLGSSLSYRGFDPRIFRSHGFETFNLGSSAQTPLQTKVLLNRYLDSLNPALVIYEVFPGPFTSDGVESSLDLIANDHIDLELCMMALGQKHIKVLNTLIYGIYRDWFGLNEGYLEGAAKDGDTYISGGFVQTKLKYFKKATYGKDRYGLNERQLQAFDEIIGDLKERKIPYILVQAPITRSRYDAYINNADYNDLMNRRGTYYNFNELIELDEVSDYYDSHHLNQNGVTRFNEKLIAFLIRNGGLKAAAETGAPNHPQSQHFFKNPPDTGLTGSIDSTTNDN